jgi:hypothetical protein
MYTGIVMQNPSMATKRKPPLTYEQLAIAKRLNSAWLKYKKEWRETHEYNMTHERAAAEITRSGAEPLTGGAIGHWLNGREPINPDRLVQLCKLIGANPLQIDPSLPIGYTVDEEETKFLEILRDMDNESRRAYMKVGEGMTEYKSR